MHVASAVLQIPRKNLRPKGIFWTETKARDESRDETDWEGYEIKEGAMIWAKVNPRKKVGGDNVRKVQRKPTIFSRGLLWLWSSFKCKLNSYLAGLCWALQPSCLSDSTQHSAPPSSPLTPLLPPLECKYWKTLAAPAEPEKWEHTGINLSRVWAFSCLWCF